MSGISVIIDPRDMEFIPWAQRSVPQLEPFGPVGDAAHFPDWKQWALAVIQLPGIASRFPPQPHTFDNWRDWASHFNMVMS